MHLPWPFNKNIKTKSPTAAGTVNVDAKIGGWISAGIDSGWNLTHNENISVNVTKAEVTVLGVIHISLKDQIQNPLNAKVPALIKGVLDSARDKLQLRAKCEGVWKQMFAPIKIASDPDAYLLMTPTARAHSGDFRLRDKMAFGTSARFRQLTAVTRKRRRTDASRYRRNSGN